MKRTACSLPVALFTLAALAAEALAGEAAAPWDPFPAEFPFYTACVSAPFPAKNTTNKSLTIDLGPAAAMSFDTDCCACRRHGPAPSSPPRASPSTPATAATPASRARCRPGRTRLRLGRRPRPLHRSAPGAATVRCPSAGGAGRCLHRRRQRGAGLHRARDQGARAALGDCAGRAGRLRAHLQARPRARAARPAGRRPRGGDRCREGDARWPRARGLRPAHPHRRARGPEGRAPRARGAAGDPAPPRRRVRGALQGGARARRARRGGRLRGDGPVPADDGRLRPWGPAPLPQGHRHARRARARARPRRRRLADHALPGALRARAGHRLEGQRLQAPDHDCRPRPLRRRQAGGGQHLGGGRLDRRGDRRQARAADLAPLRLGRLRAAGPEDRRRRHLHGRGAIRSRATATSTATARPTSTRTSTTR